MQCQVYLIHQKRSYLSVCLCLWILLRWCSCTSSCNPQHISSPWNYCLKCLSSLQFLMVSLLSFIWSWHYREMWQFPPSNRKANSSAAQSRGFTFVSPPASPLTFVWPQRLILEPKNVSQNLLQYWGSALKIDGTSLKLVQNQNLLILRFSFEDRWASLSPGKVSLRIPAIAIFSFFKIFIQRLCLANLYTYYYGR